MREIKFRAWDGRMMIEWGFIKDGLFIGPSSSGNKNMWMMPHMQYTGLKDKGGKEICEGDVANMDIMGEGKTKDNLYFFSIKNLTLGFEPCFPGKVHEADQEWRAMWQEEEREFWSSEYFEIVGNIYANPELVER